VGLVGGLVPLVNIEVYLAGVAVLSKSEAGPVVLLTTIGHMLAKSVLYLSGRGVLRLPLGRGQAAIDRAVAALHRHPRRADALVIVSAVTGLPPFYGTSIAAGLFQMPFLRFLIPATLGRLVRFALVFWLARVATR